MRSALLVLLAAGCSSARYGASETGAPSLIFPAHFAEGETGKDGGRSSATKVEPDGGATASAPSQQSALPDPVPLLTRSQWDFVFEYDRGAVRVASFRPIVEPKPVATARRVGRFAVELWLGRELVDRVRFDFPLLAVSDPEPAGHRPLHGGPSFGPGARTSATVRVPARHRATSARLLDRATGHVTPIPSPPQ